MLKTNVVETFERVALLAHVDTDTTCFVFALSAENASPSTFVTL